MKLTKKLFVLGLALVFVLGISGITFAGGHLGGPWYVDTGEYFDLPWVVDLNAEILQYGENNAAEIDQINHGFAHIGQGIDNHLGAQSHSVGNIAAIDQDNEVEKAPNQAEINQQGDYNKALIDQQGLGNYAGVGQNGMNMFADLRQDAIDSFIRVSQFGGSGSVAEVVQYGNLNRARASQDGDEHDVNIFQGEESYFNYAKVEQSGNDQEATIKQFGAENGAFVDQAGAYNWASVTQDGEMNEAEVYQDGTEFTALIDQEGDSNSALITQSGF